MECNPPFDGISHETLVASSSTRWRPSGLRPEGGRRGGSSPAGGPGGGQARSTEEKRENSPGYRNNMHTLLIINPACSSPGAANAFRFSFSR
ncbi:hypothetical protein MRB53_022930 [Persea americana]|uniref:Uncharacterized protein n=1 Tax=Persea americana TaxID=3435 RepID=A0ACC2L7Z1_PERAE|nr:hypothetical protein MRB53_022930 [Persea americana]